MKNILILFLTSIVVAAISQAAPLQFTIKGGEGNLIQFESKAPLETIIGKTDQVTGTVSFDPQDLSAGVTAQVSVDATSIKTGNKIRDGHMRDNHLHTEQYPTIEFVMNSVPLQSSVPGGQMFKTEVTGDFTLHGITRTITVPVEVVLTGSGSEQAITILANFEVKLSDYEIPRPQFLIMKLDEVQHITVDIRGEIR